MIFKALISMYLVAQALCLRTAHLGSTGANAMTAADQSALIACIVIGVVACVVIGLVVYCCLFKQPYYREAYIQGGAQTPGNGYQNQGYNQGYPHQPNPINQQQNYNNNPGYYRY